MTVLEGTVCSLDLILAFKVEKMDRILSLVSGQ